MPYDLGDLVPLTVQISNSSGTADDPGAITLTVGLPDGTSVDVLTTNPRPGCYQADYLTVQAGRHTVRWLATGINASAYTDVFDVRPASPDYLISLATAKDQCKIPLEDTTQDERLREFVEAAAYVIENHRKEAVIRRPITEYHTLRAPATRLLLRITPVISVSAVQAVDGAMVWSGADLHVTPETGLVVGAAGAVSFVGNLRASYVAGRVIMPANFSLAARIIVQHLWETTRGNARAGLWPGGQDDTTEIYGMGYAIPNRALELLGKPPPQVA